MYTYMFLGVFKDKIKFMYTDFLNVLIFFLASVQENFLIPLMPHVSDFPEAATRGQHTHIYEASILTNKASAKSGWVWIVAAQGLFQWIAIVVAVTFKGLGKKTCFYVDLRTEILQQSGRRDITSTWDEMPFTLSSCLHLTAKANTPAYS